MQTYEIRVLNDDLTPRVIFKQQFISDISAIRCGRMFAEQRLFEVWRGPTCVSGIIRNICAAPSSKAGGVRAAP